ncbi:MAG TPA: hypothetical protein VFV41_23485 [Streptosporangiaceae bacterium]|nr:hypothetical protein [Streptosporangiaceae bacterium]
MTRSRPGPVTPAARRLMAAGLAAAAMAAGAAGCSTASSGTGSGSGTAAAAQADPLAALSADQIGHRAVANLGKARSVHVTGRVSDSGQRIGLNLRLLRSHGCVGSMNLAGKGSFRLVLIGKTVWLKPDSRFWRSFGGTNPAVLKILSGKYLKTTLSSTLGGLAQLCHPSALARAFENNKGTGLVKGPATTIDGQHAIKLTDSGDSAAAYVSVTSSPELLRIVSPGPNGGTLDFTGYGAPVTLRPPPAAQTLDGRKYGF